MIGHLRGKVIDVSLSRALVESGGIGFVVHSTPSYLGKIKMGKEAEFWTHMAVRETDISLYGFEKEEELKMFESLLSVSGIGPKSALAILGVAGLEAIEEAVISGNTMILTKIAGIGKKTVEKIVLELSGKIVSNKELSLGMKDDIDVFEALQALGYRDHDIKETIREIPKDIVGANQRIKHALKLLGKNA